MTLFGNYSSPHGSGFWSAPRDFEASQRWPFLSSHFRYIPPVSPTPDGKIRVLIAGDHDCLRSSLKTMLELDPRIAVVGEAADDCETIKLARRLQPDVILIDLDMRCCDKYDAVAEITQKGLAKSVVALTIHGDETERQAAQAAGVNLFLEKGVPYKQLINAIRLAANCPSPR